MRVNVDITDAAPLPQQCELVFTSPEGGFGKTALGTEATHDANSGMHFRNSVTYMDLRGASTMEAICKLFIAPATF